MIEMIQVAEIRIQRAEGNLETDSFDPVTVATWKEANATLRTWAKTAPGPRQGYHKCDFWVTWADGETYQGRYDLEGRETETANLGAYIASLAKYARIFAQPETDQSSITATRPAFPEGYDLGGAGDRR